MPAVLIWCMMSYFIGRSLLHNYVIIVGSSPKIAVKLLSSCFCSNEGLSDRLEGIRETFVADVYHQAMMFSEVFPQVWVTHIG